MTSELIQIAHQDCSAQIALQGAELRSWQVAGEHLLWRGDPATWPRSSPVQFPLVGRLVNAQALHGGLVRPMNIHGFAREQTFQLIEHSASLARLRLVANEASRHCWPYDFELELRYEVIASGLAITMTVINPGTVSMPYSIGLHPGFCWPVGTRDAHGHQIEFEQPEDAQVPVIDDKGMLTAAQRSVPLREGRFLPLSHACFSGDALIFQNARSSLIRLRAPDGSAIAVQAEGFGNWAIWNRPPAAFVCLEAWAGMPDRADWSGEFSDRPDTRWLKAGQQREHRLRFLRESAVS